MSVTQISPSLYRAGRGGGRTAFERNILPEFALWLIEQIEARHPDYLIPAETKGARVLESVLRFAREELGTAITVPVLYGTALAFFDPDELARKRLMLVDDTVRTGTNLAYHTRRARAYGARDVQAVACIGAGDGKRRDVDCFIVVDRDLYHEYVWQLTESVVARGLPPEIDHHIYELRFSQRLPGAWTALEEILPNYGTLTVDGPRERREELLGLTLHFPRLPGRDDAIGPQDFRAVDKLRFVPDLANNSAYLVPVVFPPLEVPPGGRLASIDPGQALELLGPRGCEGGLGELLVGAAKTLNAKSLFRVNASAAEAESVLALAELLQQAVPGGVEISAHPDSFERLYGPECGKAAATRISAQLGAASKAPVSPEPARQQLTAPEFLDQEVVETTHKIVTHLRNLHRAAMAAGRDRSERIGLSVPQICDFLPDSSALLISRCLDYGMATTALVPFAGYSEEGATAFVDRRYRVSEPLRGEELAYDDIDDARIALSEQAIAVIAHNVIERSAGESSEVAPDLLAALIAILRPLVLEAHSIPLKVAPAGNQPEILLSDDSRRVAVGEVASVFFDIDETSGGFRPTPHFLDLYESGALPVEVRKSVEDVETRLEILLPLMDDLEPAQCEALLRGWTMSADQRLGLSHVRETLEQPLGDFAGVARRLIRRGPVYDHLGGIVAEAHARSEVAEQMLGVLAAEWEAVARERWGRKLVIERRFRSSLAAPAKPLSFYRLPQALAALTAALGPAVERLSAIAARQWANPGAEVGGHDIATETIEICDRTRRVLTSLDENPPARPDLSQHSAKEALARAGGELEDTTKIIRALLAACAGAYRGPEDAHMRQAQEPRRHVAVLSVDIAGSRAHRSSYPDTHEAWKNDGLNVAAQWARAFGGWEARNRFGDDILVEFGAGDAAVLCAALIQSHAAALRSTGLDAISRSFHVGLDCGQVVSQTGGNTDGDCMDRVTAIAKECEENDDEALHAYASRDAWEFCSSGLREADVEREGWRKEVSLDKGETKVIPVAVDSERLLGHYADSVLALSAELEAQAGERAPEEGFDLGPIKHPEEGGEAADGA